MNRLFRSQTCFAILSFLARNKNERFYLHQLAKRAQLDPANVNRELKRLVEQSFVLAERQGRRVYYRLSHQPALVNALEAGTQPSCAPDAAVEGAWVCGLEMDRGNHGFARCWMDGFVRPLAVGNTSGHSQVFALFENDRLKFYFDEGHANRIAQELAEQLFMRVEPMREVLVQMQEELSALKQFAHLLPQEGVSYAASDSLWNHYRLHEERQRALYARAFIPLAVEAEWKKRAIAWLRQRLSVSEHQAVQMFSVLAHPGVTTVAEEEQDALLDLAARIQTDTALAERFCRWHESQIGHGFMVSTYVVSSEQGVGLGMDDLDPVWIKDVQEHHQRFAVLGFASSGTLRPFLGVVADIARLLYQDKDCTATGHRRHLRREERARGRAELVADLKLTTEQEQCFSLWGQWDAAKQERRLIQEYALYKIQPVLEAIAKRLGLSLREVDVLLPQEVQSFLLEGRALDRAQFGPRLFSCVYAAGSGGVRYATGDEAERLRVAVSRPRSSHVELRGTTARRGFAEGIVRLISSEQDTVLVRAGEVVVAELLRPELVTSLGRAAAFVTDQGGLTSHAAIIARELGIPCVVGTKEATKLLASGMRVLVDADQGLVRTVNNTKE